MPLFLSKNNTLFPSLQYLQASLLRPEVNACACAMVAARVDLKACAWMQDSESIVDRLVYAEATRLAARQEAEHGA